MEAIIGFRVSESLLCAAAELKALICFEPHRVLADGYPEIGAPVGFRIVLADGWVPELGFQLGSNESLGMAAWLYSLAGLEGSHGGQDTGRHRRSLYQSSLPAMLGLSGSYLTYGPPGFWFRRTTERQWTTRDLLFLTDLGDRRLQRAILHSLICAQEAGRAGFASSGVSVPVMGPLSDHRLRQRIVRGSPSDFSGPGVALGRTFLLCWSPAVSGNEYLFLLVDLDIGNTEEMMLCLFLKLFLYRVTMKQQTGEMISAMEVRSQNLLYDSNYSGWPSVTYALSMDSRSGRYMREVGARIQAALSTETEWCPALPSWLSFGHRKYSIIVRGQPTVVSFERGTETGEATNALNKNREALHITQNIPNMQMLPHYAADPHFQDDNRIQIFIKSIGGGHCCMRPRRGSNIQELKKEIQHQLGIPSNNQNLICAGRSLQDHYTLQEYGICQDSTIFLNLRLRGGCKGSGSKTPASFRDAVKGKGKMQNKPELLTELPGPYIVDQKLESPILQVTMPEVIDLHSVLTKTALICRFNGFWPKSDALHQWIYSNWTPDCDIHLCSKGFFIVSFHTEEERDSIISEGPWFWGNAGLFVTPWYADFDANTMKITTMPVWVRLHNLPLHFWHNSVLAAIGNTLGKFIKMDEDRVCRGIFSFARICVEVDMSQGLPEHISLNFNNSQWLQSLDYENTAFRCRSCRQTGHLQYSCPLVKKNPKGNKNRKNKPNGWQHTNPLEEEDTLSEEADNQVESDTNMEQQGTQNDIAQDPHLEAPQNIIQQHPQLDVGGIKRSHGSEGSESDKEFPVITPESMQAIIVPSPDTQGWRRVEKKKGRKATYYVYYLFLFGSVLLMDSYLHMLSSIYNM